MYIYAFVGIACWSDNEIYSQVNKPRIHHKGVIFVSMCRCMHAHYVLLQEELRKVMSDSMNTENVEVHNNNMHA